MEEARAPKPYDPERWLQRWTVAAGVILAATILVPYYVAPWGEAQDALTAQFAPKRTGWVWAWSLSHGSQWEAIRALSPYVLGLVAALSARAARGKARAVLIGLPVMAALALSVLDVIKVVEMGAPATFVVLPALSALFLPVAAATAAGTHLTRRYPASGFIRRRTRILGLLLAAILLATFLFSQSDDVRPSHPSSTFDWSQFLSHLMMGAILTYAVVCALHFDGPTEALRIRLLAVMNRLAFPLWALAVTLGAAWERSGAHGAAPGPEPATSLAVFATWFGLQAGQYGLGALAVAAWIEPRLRGLAPVGGDVIEPVFE